MPILLIFVGAVLISSAIAGRTADLGTQLQRDFTGPGNFLYWLAAIVMIGLVGMFEPLHKASRLFLLLLVLSMLLANGRGVFDRLFAALGLPAAAARAAATGSQAAASMGRNAATPGGVARAQTAASMLTQHYDDVARLQAAQSRAEPLRPIPAGGPM